MMTRSPLVCLISSKDFISFKKILYKNLSRRGIESKRRRVGGRILTDVIWNYKVICLYLMQRRKVNSPGTRRTSRKRGSTHLIKARTVKWMYKSMIIIYNRFTQSHLRPVRLY